MNYHDEYEELLNSEEVAGGADKETILQAEKELGLIFPKAYRSFLENYGAVMGEGFDIAGLFESSEDEPPMFEHILSKTNDLRSASDNKNGGYIAILKGMATENLLEIADDGSEIRFYIDANGPPECPVYGIGHGFEEQKIADSFEEFVVVAATTEDYGLSRTS